MNNKRVIIVGGGLSGLYTALQLEQLNIPYVLFEAKDAFGGRIYSEQPSIGHEEPFLYDLGPTWIFPHHQNVQLLVANLGLNLFQQYITGDVVYHEHANTKPQIIRSGQGQLLHRLEGGLYQLILALKNKLLTSNYQLNSQVEGMKKKGDTWHVTVKNTQTNTVCEHESEHLILALPPRIIHQYLTPEHWASTALIKALVSVPTWMASQAKFVASYNKPFWREKGLAGQAFSRVGPMIEIHDASVQTQQGFALFGFIGLSAQSIKNASTEHIKKLCINQLALLFGEQAKEYNQCYLKSWGNDKYVATHKDNTEAPDHPYFNMKPFEDELFSLNLSLAGSEFAKDDAGYLEGALCAANKAISTLKKHLTY